MSAESPWSVKIAMGAVDRDATIYDLAADADQRRRIARELDLVELRVLSARIRATPWFDGLQLDGHWSAELAQACGVTLEPLESQLTGDFSVRIVLASSPYAPQPAAEEVIDLEADDPPDVADSETIDLAAYVVEYLALDIEPFPRKPGVEFEPPRPTAEISPFAVLNRLRDNKEP